MVAMRRYMRKKSVEKVIDESTLKGTHLKAAQVEEMYQVMAIANYEDRFVIPSSHKEMVENTFDDKASCGFTFGNGCSSGTSEPSLFGKKKASPIVFHDMRRDRKANAGE
jgi:nitrate reductase beta subunit